MTRRSREQMLDETRRQLLAAGRSYFGAAGYAGTSMDDLTASAGLTRGALYHHFGGKSGLLAAVVSAVDAEVDARLDAATGQSGDAVATLAERAATYIEATQAPEVQQILFLDAPAVLAAEVASSTAACVASIARLIESGQEAELIGSGVSAQALAVLINGALVDASRWVTDSPGPGSVAEATTAARALIEGLRRKD